MKKGFTLIELLIVVAIIAILAAIAVPNFLEAQIRAKVSRSKADMRSIITAVEAYRIDFNRVPPPFEGFTYSDAAGAEWWGFAPPNLTTPIAYMSSIPAMPFTDTIILASWQGWTGGTGGERNQPYTYVHDTRAMLGFKPWFDEGAQWAIGFAKRMRYNAVDGRDFMNNVKTSAFFFYTCGPDRQDGTVFLGPITYDPSNGTVSYGDIAAFGSGSADSATRSGNR